MTMGQSEWIYMWGALIPLIVSNVLHMILVKKKRMVGARQTHQRAGIWQEQNMARGGICFIGKRDCFLHH